MPFFDPEKFRRLQVANHVFFWRVRQNGLWYSETGAGETVRGEEAADGGGL